METDLVYFLKKLYFNYYHIYKLIKNYVFVPVATSSYDFPNKFVRLIPSDDNDTTIPSFSNWCNQIQMLIIDKKTLVIDNFAIYSVSLRYIFLPDHLDILKLDWENIVRGVYYHNVKVIYKGEEFNLQQIIKWQRFNTNLLRLDVYESLIDHY